MLGINFEPVFVAEVHISIQNRKGKHYLNFNQDKYKHSYDFANSRDKEGCFHFRCEKTSTTELAKDSAVGAPSPIVS